MTRWKVEKWAEKIGSGTCQENLIESRQLWKFIQKFNLKCYTVTSHSIKLEKGSNLDQVWFWRIVWFWWLGDKWKGPIDVSRLSCRTRYSTSIGRPVCQRLVLSEHSTSGLPEHPWESESTSDQPDRDVYIAENPSRSHFEGRAIAHHLRKRVASSHGHLRSPSLSFSRRPAAIHPRYPSPFSAAKPIIARISRRLPESGNRFTVTRRYTVRHLHHHAIRHLHHHAIRRLPRHPQPTIRAVTDRFGQLSTTHHTRYTHTQFVKVGKIKRKIIITSFSLILQNHESWLVK